MPDLLTCAWFAWKRILIISDIGWFYKVELHLDAPLLVRCCPVSIRLFFERPSEGFVVCTHCWLHIHFIQSLFMLPTETTKPHSEDTWKFWNITSTWWLHLLIFFSVCVEPIEKALHHSHYIWPASTLPHHQHWLAQVILQNQQICYTQHVTQCCQA